MPYYDKEGNEYWNLKEILQKKGESVTMSHIRDLGQKLFRKGVPYIKSKKTGGRLYKKDDLLERIKNLGFQIDLKENPMVELKEDESDVPDLFKPEGLMNVIYSRTDCPMNRASEELTKQNSMIMQYCIANGVKIDHTYSDNCPSYVFSKDKRPGMYELMYDMLEGSIDTVYILSPDVLSPFFYEFFIETCRMCGVRVDIISNIPSEDAKKSIQKEIITMSGIIKKRFSI